MEGSFLTKDTIDLLKRVMVYDGIILLLSFVASILFFKGFALIIAIGITVAFLNFLLNSVITEYSMRTPIGAILIPFGAVARIAIAGAFAFLLYDGMKENVVVYIIGYSLHYVSMVISAVSNKKKKRGGGQ